MKKILAAVLVVSIVFVAGAAIAQPKRKAMPFNNQVQRMRLAAQTEQVNPNIKNESKDFGDNEHKDQRPQVMPRNFGGNDPRYQRPEAMRRDFGDREHRDQRPGTMRRDFRGCGNRDQRPESMRRDFGDREHRDQRPEMMHPDFGRAPRMHGMNFTPDMPQEIREKAAELAKLKVDLEEALTSNPINKAKALEVHAKMQKLENEIDAWRFEKRLDFMEKAREMRELNKNAAPEDKPEAPAE